MKYYIIGFVGGILITFFVIFFTLDIKAEPQTKDFEYAIIYYPDMNKSVEGYVDKYVMYHSDTIEITIDGTSYLTNSRNVMLIKSSDLRVEKEKEVINAEPESND